MTKGAEQKIFQGQHKDGQQAHEKVLNTINFKTIANQNYNEISSHTVRMFINKKTINKCWRDMEKRRPLCTVSGVGYWCSQHGDSTKN